MPLQNSGAGARVGTGADDAGVTPEEVGQKKICISANTVLHQRQTGIASLQQWRTSATLVCADTDPAGPKFKKRSASPKPHAASNVSALPEPEVAEVGNILFCKLRPPAAKTCWNSADQASNNIFEVDCAAVLPAPLGFPGGSTH